MTKRVLAEGFGPPMLTGEPQDDHASSWRFQQLLPIVRHVLQVVLENEFPESVHAVTQFILNFSWQDDTTVGHWMSQQGPAADAILRARILEAFVHWVRVKTIDLDYLVEMSQFERSFLMDKLADVKNQVEQACCRHSSNEVFAEFIHAAVCELLGHDAACLGSALAGLLLYQSSSAELLSMVEWPTTLLALIVRMLEGLQAKVSKVIMELYHDAGLFTYDDSKHLLMMFFSHYTVDTIAGTLEVHDSHSDGVFAESDFRVNLVDSFGCLMKLLHHLELVCQAGVNGRDVILAVDFEGLRLCRHGALCLVQMTCSDDPTLVYVLDVYLLGSRTFTMATPRGTSMKGLLEDLNIRKVWFDPRNDVDALYHQFGIMPRGIFDLQLAEVADRRKRGLTVNYVQGLYKCLTMCHSLTPEQKVFADRINTLGKSLFEPQNGGSYEIFQQRPLNPVILVYAAHDSRYMLTLHEQYVASIGKSWVQRVLQAGDHRGRWCLSGDYVVPSSEAPDF
eukprot:TRINITY_DN43784_c0_g1_i1.p1 TRINITY_DN43784_c0_g1~~TRINITY_DN43784_c0_g1_i1.p1  ORF type:complete len:507 (+),score=58.43 TRINITY_DN43784_c0_g1_i1:157-1677(+)